MKASAVTLALLSTAAAQVGYMHVVSLRPSSPVQFLPWVAHGSKIWLGGETASYCPDIVAQQGACPPGNETTFVGGSGGLAMGAIVPGGQRIYIDGLSGELGYTQAHSASIPEGAILDGWSVETYRFDDGLEVGELSWEGGYKACPHNDTSSYQILAYLPNIYYPDQCLSVEAIFTNSSQPSAWQYT